MENKRTYTIEINGIEQSIKQVDALSDALQFLDKKIKELESRSVSVTSSSNGGGGNRTAELNTEDKLLKQIQSTEQQIRDARREDYQSLLAQKDILKDIVSEAQERAAAERLSSGNYDNTMKGLKQELSDIKKVMQTTDLGDEKFQEMTQRANELTSKLKELEQAYGQFGRNVGSYASAAEGFSKLQIEVNGVTREFDNAKQAMVELRKEMQTLSVKQDLGIISEEEAKRLESLIPTVKQLESSVKDAGVAMDSLMDIMQGVVAIGSTAEGLSALFGFDDDEIQKSIQKLVALQNVLQGLQTLQTQMNASEGIGLWLSKGNAAVDKLAASIIGVGKASKAATVATKALGTALKALGIGVVVGLVTELISLIETWSEKQEKAAKEAEEAAEKVKQAIDEQRKTFVGASATYMNTASRLSHLRTEYMTTNNELRKTSILKEASEEFKNLGISVKSVTDAQRILVDQGDKVIEMLRLQGDAAALAALRVEAFKKYYDTLMEDNYGAYAASVMAGGSGIVAELDKRMDEVNAQIMELQKELGVDIKKGSNETKKIVVNAEDLITKARINAMKDGLNKRLIQLDEEKRQTLAKLKKNSQEYLEAEKIYNELRIQEIEKYQSKVNEALSKDREQIEKTSLDNQIEEIENYISRLEKNVPKINELLSKNDLQSLLMKGNYQVVMNYLKFLEEAFEIGYDNLSDEMKDYIDQFELHLKSELDTVRSYSDLETASLKDSFQTRINDARDYYLMTLDMMTIAVEEERNLREQQLSGQTEAAKRAAAERFKEQRDEYQRELDAAQKQFDALQEIANEGQANLTDEQREQWKQLQDIILTNQEYIKQSTENFTKELENIEKKYDNAIVALNLQTFEKRNSIQEKYFDTQIANYRDFNSKLNQEIQKQPVIYKGGFEIINIGATRKNFKEIKDAVKTVLKGIQEDKNELNEQWNEGLLTPETYSSTLRQLNDIERATTEEFEQISENIKKAWGDWWGSIDQWLQQVGQTMNTILSSLSEIQSNQYEEQIDQQEKYIEEYEKLLDKQKEITEQHASEIDSIEDELSTARGDRRQQLIDQLNAEMAAQRASLAQQKKIEKEKEKAEHKKAELEYQQAVAKKHMQESQALINAAMAVSMAAVNDWPIPAIPMMALAAAAGAAQIAAIQSQNIPSYGSGGVIQGKSHRDGGVPVLGGRAEVEGGEFITNKVTTSKNVDLLEYINTKRKKISLEDLIDFYGGNSQVKKSITTVRTKFADGGMIPTLRNDINLSDRMLTAFEDYSNRPVQVAVVDIIDRTQAVNDVRVMAGLE